MEDFELSTKERLILINQYNILKIIDKTESKYYEKCIDILENGYSIFYDRFTETFSEMSEKECIFVLNVLGLFEKIDDLKTTFTDKAFLDHTFSTFRGFDGNDESKELSFVKFLIFKDDRFGKLSQTFSEDLNSHMPMKDKYFRMLTKFNSLNSPQLSFDDLLSILDA